ncbi:glycosyltransferase [Paraglaciecola polaris]|uniref:Glycosyltransferase n=1 Tax=Paraglaciecola polaris LMG 21857 TaxID=1129793 RepID=K6ZDT8_9ALTE|nr:glycosyltransferase [Paraglaciecola polaris]GAC34246.1 glycosyltransferase [Paraglaciecola polaris LMG 21857]
MTSKLKVLQFICPTGFYGAERWVLALAKHLDPSTVSCDLAVTMEPGQKPLELVSEYKKLNLGIHIIEMKNKFDLGAVARLAKLIREQNIDIIHTHGYKSDIIGVLAARRAKIKCIVTPHGFENAKDFKLRSFIWLGCQSMRFAHKVVPLSQQLMRDVLSMGVKPQNALYIQNGVDLSEVEAEPIPVRTEPGKKRIGFVGQMISRKNIRDILDIFDQLHKKQPNTELILLGDGDARQALEDYSKTLDCKAAIDFLGFRDDRLSLLKSFDLFVMTSTLEGIPRCLMEATAASIPVAAYDIPGIDQLISHEKTGLLATLGDKKTLLAYWEKLLFDPSYVREITENAKQFVYDNYSAQRMAVEYSDLFEEITKDS